MQTLSSFSADLRPQSSVNKLCASAADIQVYFCWLERHDCGHPLNAPGRDDNFGLGRPRGGTVRQLRDNYKTTTRQLSDNYVTT